MKNKLSIGKVRDICESQGMTYALLEGYLKPKEVEYKELSQLLQKVLDLKPIFDQIDEILDSEE